MTPREAELDPRFQLLKAMEFRAAYQRAYQKYVESLKPVRRPRSKPRKRGK